MLRTALLSLGLALLGYLDAAWLTENFRVWTAEGARRLTVIEHPVDAPPVRLVGPGEEAGGRMLPQWLASGEGGATIVDFIYTRCVSVCSALGSGFEQLQQTMAANPQDRVKLLSISFDPLHDDAAALARYAAQLHADPRLWRFATLADVRELRHLLAAYQVVVIPDGQGGYEHNAALLVIDARGRLVRIFDYADLDLALAYARSLGKGAS